MRFTPITENDTKRKPSKILNTHMFKLIHAVLRYFEIYSSFYAQKVFSFIGKRYLLPETLVLF